MLRGRAYDPVKRALDIVGSTLALLFLSPVIGVTALLVRRNLGSPVIFKQSRPGKDAEIFTLYKFRSMREPNPAKGLVSNEARITPFGRRLRATSLDELPSLANVLLGHMSLVGPRPLLPEYLPLYTPFQARRHDVRPGITGLAQVRGRNQLPWRKRFELDVEYVDRRSLLTDLDILFRTFSEVLRKKGIASKGHVVGAPFEGNGLADE